MKPPIKFFDFKTKLHGRYISLNLQELRLKGKGVQLCLLAGEKQDVLRNCEQGKCGTHGTRGPKKHLNYSPAGDHILLECGCEYCIYGQQCCPSTGRICVDLKKM